MHSEANHPFASAARVVPKDNRTAAFWNDAFSIKRVV